LSIKNKKQIKAETKKLSIKNKKQIKAETKKVMEKVPSLGYKPNVLKKFKK
jgi:DNA-binding LacI/PurR family transcriptional regulator